MGGGAFGAGSCVRPFNVPPIPATIDLSASGAGS